MNPVPVELNFQHCKCAQNLSLLKERVEALLAGRMLDFVAFPAVNASLANKHRHSYHMRLDHRAKEGRLLLARIAQRHAEIASLEVEIATGHKLLSIQEQQLDMRHRLLATGASSRKQALDVETALEQARVQLQSKQGKLEATKEALAEAEAAHAGSDAAAKKLWSEELVNASAELIEVQQSIKKHADRIEQLIVRAPARGRVQEVLQRSAGEVVRPPHRFHLAG